MAKTAQRTIVGSPLTPALLTELGAIRRRSAAPAGFDPEGDWEHAYRIWTCHGYRESGNQDVGSLRIHRSAVEGDETFRLRVKQAVVETDGLLSLIEAEITCLSNKLSRPAGWQLSSRFIGPDDTELAGLGTTETASVAGDTMLVQTPATAVKRAFESPMTSDWCLLDAIQRLDFGEDSVVRRFNMLEGLSVHKTGQQLRYRGRRDMRFGPEVMPLHCFELIGHGVLPTEYWLDSRHCLRAVISMNRAYILDEQAEKTFEERRAQSRQAYRRMRARRRKERP